jgi:hypothetical protein
MRSLSSLPCSGPGGSWREKTDGWDVWGNEVKNDVNIKFNKKEA